MLIEPKIRGFICTAAHPVGCESVVKNQIETVLKNKKTGFEGKRILIIGASTGYGLASRIASTFAFNAKTIGVFYEREASDKRTASPGWYNSAAFERFAHQSDHYAKSINGDAFSDELKHDVIALIKKELKKIDLIIYSLASPRRLNPETGVVSSSVLKPIGQAFHGKTVDAFKNEVKEVTIEPANEAEIVQTVDVMGGDDWARWIDFLAKENLLEEGVKTVAFSYIGPELTHAIYKAGTIGQAKNHLKETADALTKKLSALHGKAEIAVCKAVVTQASAAIPVVPLYIAILFRVMKEAGTHEGCIQQMYRLFADYLFSNKHLPLDQDGMIRLDDLEMSPDIQAKVAAIWPIVNSENVGELTDIAGYREEFYKLFGFQMEEVDYSLPVNPAVLIPSLS